MTQLLSGHGCFNEFLYKIDRAPSPVCAHCASRKRDSADHTLLECRAWFWHRYNLYDSLGFELGDIDPPDLGKILGAMLGGRRQWSAMHLFAEKVMLAKEQAERKRQGIG
ncbi:uncharacterized protein LOC105427307 [Pogonomyrmex barbatus]|uniref:Uncharacterized protein LOC105427307 n=1 Tax=Pogonomyrmex barbatus TaxID=144034 RepID=A0A6I9W6M7_9HYME|nr:uncharacterized protein LOC105427307 [Pogonomyrmex barbatus]